MDPERCLEVLADRCAAILSQLHRPVAGRLDRSAILIELNWLASDADRWGVPRREVASQVFARLQRQHGLEAASILQVELLSGFGGAAVIRKLSA